MRAAYADTVAVGDRVDQFRELARQALHDLFDQREPFGRLALVQVLMLAGDTLVTISLAGSLFFSISPHAAKDRVFLYLLLTIAPFAVVSPLLGPLIDKSRGARRAMVVFSALGRAALCALMASHTNDLLLFPLAFFVLVLSKLYLVTRGALVPEMVAAGTVSGTGWAAAERPLGPEGDIGAPARTAGSVPAGYAALNARLTLLGTVAGFVASVPGVILLKLAGAPGVLVFDAFVFLGAAVAGSRLPAVPRRRGSAGRRGGPERTPAAGPEALDRPPATGAVDAGWDEPGDPDLARLQQAAHPEVLLGLTTMSLIRGLAGFLVFLLAFGLRREHASLWWYGLALGERRRGAARPPPRLPAPPAADRAADPPRRGLAHRRGGPGLRLLGDGRGTGGPGLLRGAGRLPGPALLRRHDPAAGAAGRPGPHLRPVRHPPAAGLGGGGHHPGGGGLPLPGRGRGDGRGGRGGGRLLRDQPTGTAPPRLCRAAAGPRAEPRGPRGQRTRRSRSAREPSSSGGRWSPKVSKWPG